MESFIRPPQRSDEFDVPRVRFVGEQDGLPERELKSRLVELFRRDRIVVNAYLARVGYGDRPLEVALCLCSHFAPDPKLAAKVGKIFASMFGRHEHLDIIFPSREQEAQLATCCQPFFCASCQSSDTTSVDLVTFDPMTDEMELIMVESRPWGERGELLLELQEKLHTYLHFVTSGQLVETFPRAAGRHVRFRLDCAHPIGPMEVKFLDLVRTEWLQPLSIELIVAELLPET